MTAEDALTWAQLAPSVGIALAAVSLVTLSLGAAVSRTPSLREDLAAAVAYVVAWSTGRAGYGRHHRWEGLPLLVTQVGPYVARYRLGHRRHALAKPVKPGKVPPDPKEHVPPAPERIDAPATPGTGGAR